LLDQAAVPIDSARCFALAEAADTPIRQRSRGCRVEKRGGGNDDCIPLVTSKKPLRRAPGPVTQEFGHTTQSLRAPHLPRRRRRDPFVVPARRWSRAATSPPAHLCRSRQGCRLEPAHAVGAKGAPKFPRQGGEEETAVDGGVQEDQESMINIAGACAGCARPRRLISSVMVDAARNSQVEFRHPTSDGRPRKHPSNA